MKNKGEQGSITLFVSLSCIFMFVLIITFMMNMENKKQAQNKENNQIIKNYNVNEYEIEKKYEEAISNN